MACGGQIEIRTDPKNTAYVVTEGARKRDLGEDKMEDGDVKIMTLEEREALRANAFANLEVTIEDKERLAVAKERIEDLQDVQDRHWEDPYEKNQRLRQGFRAGRKQREKDASAALSLQEKMSFGYDLLPANEDDAMRAGFIEFGDANDILNTSKALSKPLFASEKLTKASLASKSHGSNMSKTERLAKQRREDLAAKIQGNTRVKMDPFLTNPATSKVSIRSSLGIKRKRDAEDAIANSPSVKGLVDYDSE